MDSLFRHLAEKLAKKTTRRAFFGTMGGCAAIAAVSMLPGEFKRVLAGSPNGPAVPPPDGISASVWELIRNTFLVHKGEFPDSNESVDALAKYLSGTEALQNDALDEALQIFTDAVSIQPDSRHAHAGLATALRTRYLQTGSAADLQAAVTEFITASELGMEHGRVRYTDLIGRGLAKLGDAAEMDRVFTKALAVADEPYVVRLDYANALRLLSDSRAENWLREGMEIAPDGNDDAKAGLAEWFLDQGRYDETLSLLAPDERLRYLQFLIGYALEQVGRADEARSHYLEAAGFSQDFPMPAKYRILGSSAQEGIKFEGPEPLVTAGVPTSLGNSFGPAIDQSCSGQVYLSRMLYCEARGESWGGMRAAAWTARTRVFKGTVYCCVSISNGGSNLCTQYYNVLTQPYQFCIGCCRTSTTDDVAYETYYGFGPDPISGYCPGNCIDLPPNYICTDTCSPNMKCWGNQNGASTYGPMFFYSTSGSCPTYHPGAGSCSHNHGKRCGNGGYDHCFYNVHCGNNCC